MSAKTRRLKSSRQKNTKGSLFTILLVFIIFSVIAAVVAYFFYDLGYHKGYHARNTSPALMQHNASIKKTAIKSLLEGSWVSQTDGRMLEIHGENFTLERPSVSDHEVIKGKILLSGKKVRFLYTAPDGLCSGNPGIYSFSLQKGELHFTSIKEECKSRKRILTSVWKKF
jgi:hypothetical protein